MVKGPPTASPGIYSATYSNIPVYEFQFGVDLKEHVMRRRCDDWINATHILKAVGFDKPARTRILERDVQKLPDFEKIQGGYGKYQGTWIPLANGADLAKRNNVYDKLAPIFEFRPGNVSPPPAPKHTTNKPKAPKKPAVPKFNMSVPTPMREASYDNMSTQQNDDETPDDVTVASQSFMGDHDDYNMPPSQPSTGHRKRKRNAEETAQTQMEQAHTLYADELLDYFMLSQEGRGSNESIPYPEPPPHFQPNWPIDSEGHTALSWACAMGDVEVTKALLRFGADVKSRNVRNETPLMRSVFFVNCYDKKTFPAIAKELIETIDLVDDFHATVMHHAAALTHSKTKNSVARYYLDVLMSTIYDFYNRDDFQRLIDAQDIDGNTALHIAAQNDSRKCIRSLLGRDASSDIPNNLGQTAEFIISRSREDRLPQASSSPFAPHRMDYPRPSTTAQGSRPPISHHSEAAMTVEQKIAPTMMEKFRDLAKSFDTELVDAETSEKSSRRILAKNQEDVQAVRDQIQAMLRKEESQGPWNRAEQADILNKEEALVLSLVEQQQQYKLHSLVQYEDSQATAATMNGNHSTQSMEQDLAEKNEVAMRLIQEMEKRKGLVKEYVDARSTEGAGENTDKYRRLLITSLKLDSNISQTELEGSLDDFIKVFEDAEVDHAREVNNESTVNSTALV